MSSIIKTIIKSYISSDISQEALYNYLTTVKFDTFANAMLELLLDETITIVKFRTIFAPFKTVVSEKENNETYWLLTDDIKNYPLDVLEKYMFILKSEKESSICDLCETLFCRYTTETDKEALDKISNILKKICTNYHYYNINLRDFKDTIKKYVLLNDYQQGCVNTLVSLLSRYADNMDNKNNILLYLNLMTISPFKWTLCYDDNLNKYLKYLNELKNSNKITIDEGNECIDKLIELKIGERESDINLLEFIDIIIDIDKKKIDIKMVIDSVNDIMNVTKNLEGIIKLVNNCTNKTGIKVFIKFDGDDEIVFVTNDNEILNKINTDKLSFHMEELLRLMKKTDKEYAGSKIGKYENYLVFERVLKNDAINIINKISISEINTNVNKILDDKDIDKVLKLLDITTLDLSELYSTFKDALIVYKNNLLIGENTYAQLIKKIITKSYKNFLDYCNTCKDNTDGHMVICKLLYHIIFIKSFNN